MLAAGNTMKTHMREGSTVTGQSNTTIVHNFQGSDQNRSNNQSKLSSSKIGGSFLEHSKPTVTHERSNSFIFQNSKSTSNLGSHIP